MVIVFSTNVDIRNVYNNFVTNIQEKKGEVEDLSDSFFYYACINAVLS
jgi:hypothetical protein